MRKEDIKVGMKVKVLRCNYEKCSYNLLKEWLYDEKFWSCDNDLKKEIEQIHRQGFGYVQCIDKSRVIVTCDKSILGWSFAFDDIEPYEEDETTQQSYPKLTDMKPFTIFTLRNGDELILLREEGVLYDTKDAEDWSVFEDYDEELCIKVCGYDDFDIVKIEYRNEIVWERQE